ncbi:glutaredoxin 2 [Colwellia sp. 1_MG-2023]|uniref:glutaredoxin 2 n=1 Tax=Colwellia sp. 1_MG-2023 TaxID=3062649 RepID=UPI0026E47CDB|nr:glutaredoxin 2 [Colwellia sp. 1_MG-2023]MDO6445426.1 glutaredoxin 2 [Colwellia sp. 1_MG-2023]
MKLYIYKHCPFCARVRFIARQLKIEIEEVVIEFDDSATPIDLIGKRSVPILVADDETVMAESLDIIAHFKSLAGISVPQKPELSTLEWQSAAFPLIQQIGYPRWHLLGLEEFKTYSSRLFWKERKQTPELKFDNLLKNSTAIVSKINSHIELLESNHKMLSDLPLLDQAIHFSLLRGLYSTTDIKNTTEAYHWVQSKSEELGIELLVSSNY